MRQKYGPISRRPATRTLESSSVNRSDIARKFSWSWSLSVMLGTVVAMAGLLMAHLSAAAVQRLAVELVTELGMVSAGDCVVGRLHTGRHAVLTGDTVRLI